MLVGKKATMKISFAIMSSVVLIFAINCNMQMVSGSFEVHTFNDPELALSSFRLGFYDLALLDMKMPKMYGHELYDEMKKIEYEKLSALARKKSKATANVGVEQKV